MKILRLVFGIFWLLLCVTNVNSAPISGNNTRVSQLTRSVKNFSELETELIAALKTNNQDKLKHLLAEDFEMRQASKPDNPIPYADWLKNSLAEASSYSTDIEQMSVHDLNQTAIVNFLWQPSTESKFFIVDIWRLNGKNWQLAIRYLTPIADINTKIPGFIPNEQEIEKKY